MPNASITLTGLIMPDDWLWPGDDYYPADPGISFKRVQDAIARLGDFDALTLYLDSEGGVIEEGFRIYDYLTALGKPITTISYGIVASMCTVLFSLGTSRFLSPHAKYMTHLPGGGAMGNKLDLQEYIDLLVLEETRILQIYAATTGKDESELAALLADGKDHWFTADEAVGYGWATGIYNTTTAHATRAGRAPITARLKDGRAGLGLSATPALTAQTDSPNTIQDKMNAIVQKGIDALSALLKGTPTKAQLVKTADDKELDITTAGESYAIGDSLKYSDGSEVPDGDIVLADGTTITVAAGVITAIEAPAEEGTTEDTADASASADNAETVTISKAEFDRLSQAATTAEATATAHASLQTEFNQFKTRTSAVLAAIESKDPLASIEPGITPIDKRTPAPAAGPGDLIKKANANKNK